MKSTTIFTALATMALTVGHVAAYPTVMDTQSKLSTRDEHRIPGATAINSTDSVNTAVLSTVSSLLERVLQKRHCKIQWFKERFCTPDDKIWHKPKVHASKAIENKANIAGLPSVTFVAEHALPKRHCKIHWFKERFCTPDGHKRDIDVDASAVDENNVDIPGLHPIPVLSPTPNEAAVSNEQAGHQYINAVMKELEPIVRQKSFAMEPSGLDTVSCIQICRANAYTDDCRKCTAIFLKVVKFGTLVTEIPAMATSTD